MVKAVFIQNPTSIYDDQPGEAYHFPKRYLNLVKKTVGDWVVFYEGRLGAFGYVSIAKVLDVVEDHTRINHYYALLKKGMAWDFEQVVPRADENNIAFEMSLRDRNGAPSSGGGNVSAVRHLSEREFARIVDRGLRAQDIPEAMPRTGSRMLEDQDHGFAEFQTDFDPAPLAGVREEILISRKVRDASFARMVKAAYGARCAISGLELRNGGGRPEVEAAHIRPVEHDGPDVVRNGIALSGTLHWMFDRGLISIAPDWTILVSHNKVQPETARRLINSRQKFLLPENRRHYPHPDYLRFHREEIFGQGI
jgi:putative restriction endonuclease